MNIDVMPTLIDQFRETFEGEVTKGMVWITDGPPDSAVFGLLDSLTPDDALAAPAPGVKSIAQHAAHLRFSLDLMAERLQGANPPADWPGSFRLTDASADGWAALKRDLRRAYDAVIAILQTMRSSAVQDVEPIKVAGLAAMTGHNAYHLGAMRQLARIVRG